MSWGLADECAMPIAHLLYTLELHPISGGNARGGIFTE